MKKLLLIAALLFAPLSFGQLAQGPPTGSKGPPVPVVAAEPVPIVAPEPISVTQSGTVQTASNQAIWIAIATSLVSLVGVMFTGIMAYMMAKLNNKAQIAENDRVEVKATLAEAQRAADTDRVEVKATLEKVQASADADRTIVKQTLADTAEASQRKADETLRIINTVHTLVNNNMRIQLVQTAMFARRVANLTKKREDIVLAATADKAVIDHDKGQATVDAGMKVIEKRQLAEPEPPAPAPQPDRQIERRRTA